jgi:hypothetical protein
VLQVIPAAVVAVYGVVLASVLVIAQLASRGSRTVRMLLQDLHLRGVVAGTVVIAVLGTWLAGLAPGSGAAKSAHAAPGVQAWPYTGAAALAVLSALVLLATVVVLGQSCHRYCSPYQFHLRLTRLAERGEWPLVESTKAWRQWLCAAAREGAARDLLYACRTAVLLADAYVEVIERDPSFADTPRYEADEREAGEEPRGRGRTTARRGHRTGSVGPTTQGVEESSGADGGDDRTGWYVGQLSQALVRAIEEGARANIAWRNLDELLIAQMRLLRLMILHGRVAEAGRVVRGMAEICDLAPQAEQERTKKWFDHASAELSVAASWLDAAGDRAAAPWQGLLAQHREAVGQRKVRSNGRLELGVALLGCLSVWMVTAGGRARGVLTRMPRTT